jgi:hypothetical protein
MTVYTHYIRIRPGVSTNVTFSFYRVFYAALSKQCAFRLEYRADDACPVRRNHSRKVWFTISVFSFVYNIRVASEMAFGYMGGRVFVGCPRCVNLPLFGFLLSVTSHSRLFPCYCSFSLPATFQTMNWDRGKTGVWLELHSSAGGKAMNE